MPAGMRPDRAPPGEPARDDRRDRPDRDRPREDRIRPAAAETPVSSLADGGWDDFADEFDDDPEPPRPVARAADRPDSLADDITVARAADRADGRRPVDPAGDRRENRPDDAADDAAEDAAEDGAGAGGEEFGWPEFDDPDAGGLQGPDGSGAARPGARAPGAR
ncbi:MAG TPA: hypothetical protein VGH99_18770 [Pseudonocardia sp.]